MTNDKKFFYKAAMTVMAITLISCDKKVEEEIADLTSSAAFALGQDSVSSQSNFSAGLKNPGQMVVAGSKLILADSGNNRVLIWNTMPASAMTPADVVLGASSPSALTIADSISASTLNNPIGVATDGTKLVVTDNGNSRMLIWNSIPTTSGAAADHVFGQADMTTGNPSLVAATKLYNPTAAYVAGDGKLYVSDTGHNRVLIWNSIPTSDNASPNTVLGQGSLTTDASGTTATTLKSPGQMVVSGTKLLVADTNNCRVLIYNTPATTGAAAVNVIGQVDLTTADCTTTSATKFRYPKGVASVGTEIFIADTDSSRIARFAIVPAGNGETILTVIGQADGTSYMPNRGGEVAADGMSYPRYLLGHSSALYASDAYNNRLLKWNAAPMTNAAPDLQLGQVNFKRHAANQPIGGTTATSFLAPETVHTDGTRFYVVDSGNNRVLIYSAVPSNNAATPIVVGQPDLLSGDANNGGLSASTLSNPKDVFSDGTRLFVADYGNKRVLIWNSIPTSNGQPADIALGASNLTSSGSGTHDASGMTSPIAVMVIGTKLLVGDSGFTRIMVWNTIPTANDAASDFVLGRPDANSMPTGTANDKEFFFSGMATDGTRLFVTDAVGYRVLVWNSIPSTDYVAADFALGQADLTTVSQPSSISLTEFGSVGRVSYSNGKLFVSDPSSNRVLVWNSLTGSNQQAADHYFGQSTSTSSTANEGGISATSLWSPGGVNFIGSLVFVTDTNNNRVLVFPDTLLK